jgi:hypothetical protein
MVIFTYNLKTMKMNMPIYLAVLNFNTVTVNLYCISTDEQERISNEIFDEEDDAIVQQFMSEHGHKESECNYMFSRAPITVFAEGEQIYE